MPRLIPLLLLSFLVHAAEPNVVLQRVTGGLSLPVSITHAGDSRLFITQQGGRIVIYDGTRVLPQPFLDVSSLISTGNERGLLSVAFDPHYAQNGRFYIDYTDRNGDTVIARYNVSSTNPNVADPSSRVQLLFIPQPYPNHNGGQLQFGPDGYLYIGMGDGGSGGDPGNRAQNLSELLGKLLRIDVSGATYSVPPSNPFVTRANARGEIWAFGLRNPWRFSFDRASGDLWIADVGQGDWEEIDFQSATSIGGENYGWRRMEGTHCFTPSTNCRDATMSLPVIEYGHVAGACSVTGGYVYRGARYLGLQGTYIYGDYCNGVIWGARRDANGIVTSRVLTDAPFTISTFGEDVNGELFVADHQGGALYRVTDTAPIVRRRAARH
ncbi:MAG TPA: PQQ-dependent sugar dehydrogenase [Thermoanaerobaculia bacterium]|nr:PQQ-dependent sugar dehydrogenase [Thermoanaerobaculia bacterium]